MYVLNELLIIGYYVCVQKYPKNGFQAIATYQAKLYN
jgi:hypothetical protein